jgi:predicted ATP-grasp superfamily ATP-dependent carboligase
MEPLALLAILVAIICVGYIVVNVVFNIVNTIIDFVETNKFAIVVILALMLAFWLGHVSFQ